MKRRVTSLAVLATLCASALAAAPANSPPPPPPPASPPPKVIRVTRLDSAGPGTLREALSAKEPRLIVFEVGGVIDLARDGLVIDEPHVTIAGQTAPPPGVTLIRGGITIRTHDVRITHLRVRPGDAGQPKKSGWSPDGISTYGPDAHHVVIDHCSLTWAEDENLSASGPRHDGRAGTSHDVTFSNCIIAEGLNDSSNEKGPHSKGSLIHDHCCNISIVANLYANNADRNPYFKADTTGVVVNNVIYNPGYAAVLLNYVEKEYRGTNEQPHNAMVAVVGNVYIPGRDTRRGLAMLGGRGDAFVEDNLVLGHAFPAVDESINTLEARRWWPADLKPLPARDVLAHVLAHAGAWPKDRDEIDRRIVQSVRDRTGRIIDSQDEVGGYPHVEPTHRPLTVPPDHFDEWLATFAARAE
jgi:hypothetical protein